MEEKTHRIHRHNYQDHYTILPNHIFEDPYLSAGSKWLLAYLLTRPKDWIVYRSQLAKVYKGDKKGNGKKAVDGWFQELMEAGYIEYTLQDPETKKFIHRYDVYPERNQEIKKNNTERLKGATTLSRCGFKYPQQSNEYKQRNEENNNRGNELVDDIENPEKPNESVVVSSQSSELEKLKIPKSAKYRIINEHPEKIDLLVQRVLAWEGRECDLRAVWTILSRWDEWVDNLSFEDNKLKNEKFLEELELKDGDILNKHSITRGEKTDGKYIAFQCGEMYREFIISQRDFIKELKKFATQRLNLKIGEIKT